MPLPQKLREISKIEKLNVRQETFQKFNSIRVTKWTYSSKDKNIWNICIFHHITQFSGTPVSAFGRIQLNMEVMAIEEIPFMRNLSSMYLPILWIEDGVSLGKKFTNMLKYQLILWVGIQTPNQSNGKMKRFFYFSSLFLIFTWV